MSTTRQLYFQRPVYYKCLRILVFHMMIYRTLVLAILKTVFLNMAIFVAIFIIILVIWRFLLGLVRIIRKGDMLFLNNMRYVSMTHGAIDPTSFIYTSKPRKYTRYTLSSKMEDFELFNNMLNEIIINSSIK